MFVLVAVTLTICFESAAVALSGAILSSLVSAYNDWRWTGVRFKNGVDAMPLIN